jgi:glucose-6-phosphate isomerase
VNVGTERLETLFCYATDAGQDYGIIADAGGMRRLVVVADDGWTVRDNPEHTGYRGASHETDGVLR